jgi:NAD(P)H-binding
VIVVAGGTGTLGTRLVPCLAEAGLAVRVLTRDPARARHLGRRVAVVRGDVRDPASIGRALRGAGTVISAVHGFTGPEAALPPRWTGPGTRTSLTLPPPAERHRPPGRAHVPLFPAITSSMSSAPTAATGTIG